MTRLTNAAASLAVTLGLLGAAQVDVTAAELMHGRSSAIQSLVPEKFRNGAKPLVIGVNPDIPPVKFVDEGGKFAGFAPDLVLAAAKKLGVRIDLQQTSFDALIPGLKSGRYNVLLSLGELPTRYRSVIFVDYMNAGQSLVSNPSWSRVLTSLNQLCGISVAVTRGMSTVTAAEGLSQKCVSEGKKQINVTVYADENAALLSTSNASSELAWTDSSVASYNASRFPNRYKVVFSSYLNPYGVGFGVDEEGRELAHAFQAAFIELQKEGAYASLMSKWGLSEKDALPDFPIKGGN